MKYCTRCLYPDNHPLGITFDSEGVCSGCRIHEEKDTLDWKARRLELKKILDQYKNKKSNIYDCVIPVSGARDSYFIVHTIKKEFGLNPLLVSYNRHYNTEVGIRNLAYLRTHLNCDYMQMVISPDTVKKISRETIRLIGSMHWHVLAGQTVFPVQVASKFKIPLIIWGVHQGCDQVGMYSHLDEVEMTRKYRCDHDLLGVEAEMLVTKSDELSEDDLKQYFYPHDRELSKVGVRGIYLSNYIRWDTKKQHEDMLELYSYETTKQQRTFDTYNDVDCHHYNGIHDYIKYLKYGYGKVTDHVCREIRLKRLSRNSGIELIERYQNVIPKDLNIYLEWLGMQEGEFFDYIDNFVDKKLWEKDGNNYIPKFNNNRLTNANNLNEIIVNDSNFNFRLFRKSENIENDYKLLAKGYLN